MIKSLKFDEYRNITEIEFEAGVSTRYVLETMYELGIKRRPAAHLDTSMKTDGGRVWRPGDKPVSVIMADSLHELD